MTDDNLEENELPQTEAEEEEQPKALRPNRPALFAEGLEPRILLSATWVDADSADPLGGATDGDDIYTGTEADDIAYALDGDDSLFGDHGDDLLDGGGGADLLDGDEGDDTLLGGAGDDQLVGGHGGDVLSGGSGDDLLEGGEGDDTFVETVAQEGAGPIDLEDLTRVSHWSLGDADDSAVVDDAGGPAGTYHGPVVGVEGPEPGTTAADFDGTDDYVEIPHDAGLELDDGAVHLTFNADDTSGTQGLLSKDSTDFDNGGHLTMYLEGSTLKVRLQSASDSYFVEATGITAGEWHDVSFSFGSEGMQLFVDGVLRDSDAYTGGLGSNSGGTGNTEPVVIGANQWSSSDGAADNLQHFFSGKIADVAITAGQVDADTVTNLHAATRADESDNDTIDGGAGVDTVDYSAVDGAVDVDLAAGTASGAGMDTLIDIENVVGTAHDDSLVGDAGDNVLEGGSGNDVLDGGDGDDTLLAAGEVEAPTELEDFTRVGHWSLGDSTDAAAVDEMGIAAGTYTGGVTLGESGPEPGQTAAGFDGSDDYVEIPHDSAFELDSGTLQISFNADDTTGAQTLFSKDSSGYDNGGHLTAWLDGSTLTVRLQSDTANHYVYAEGITAGEWHDMAFTFGAGGMELFVDGVLQDTDAYTGGLGSTSGGSGNTEPITIGASQRVSGDGVANSLQDFFGGRIADVALIDGQLDDGQVEALHGQRASSDDDTISGGAGVDTVDYSAAAGGVVVDLVAGTATGAGNDMLSGIENVTGSSFDDTLSGDSGANVLTGGAGDDVLDGGAGDDLLQGGAGADTLTGGAGTDTVSYVDASSGVTVDLTIETAQDTGGGGIDTLSGIEGFVGGRYDDTIALTSPTDGATYTIDGGGGSNTIDLSGVSLSDVEFSEGQLQITTDGVSYTVVYSNVAVVELADMAVALDGTAPTVEAGADQSVDEGDLVTLGGIGVDPQGDALTYEWVQVSGPSVVLTGADGASPSFTAPNGLTNTDLVFELRVSDGETTSVDTVTVHVAADDDAPSANAGADQFVDENDTVTLTGSGVDPEGQGLTYEWVQTGGPSVTLTGANATRPTFAAPEGLEDSELTFELRVSDGVSTSVDTVTVHVAADDDGPIALGGDVGESFAWSFDGVDGAAGTDAVVAESATFVGGVSTVDVPEGLPFDAAIALDGVDDYVDLGPDVGEVLGGTATLTTWIRTSDSAATGNVWGWPSIVGSEDSGAVDDMRWGSIDANGFLHVSTGNSSGVASNVAINDGEWHHVALSRDAATGEIEIFIDGVLVGQGTGATGEFAIPEAHLGQTNDYNGTDHVHLEAEFADVRVFSRVLSVDEVTQTMQGPQTDAGTVVEEGGEYTLETTKTWTDPEGGELTYEWVQVSGPAVQLDDAASQTPTFTAPEGLANTEVGFELRVSDGVNTSTESVTITIEADDDAPSADAGVDLAVDEGDAVTLTGTGIDPEGQGLTYEWVQTGGPTVALTGADGASPNFEAPEGLANTDLTFELRVSDGVNTSIDSVTVHVAADDDAPSANAGADQFVDEGTSVTLDGSGIDPEAQDLTYTWVQTSGTPVELSDANAARPTFEAPNLVAGEVLTFELTVSDGVNETTDTVSIDLSADNDGPLVGDDSIWFDEAREYESFQELHSDFADFLGNQESTISFTGLSEGTIAGEQWSADGVHFENAVGDKYAAYSGVRPEGGNIVEHLTGYDGSIRPHGDSAYVKFANDDPASPFTITFDEPVASIGAIVGMGVQGTDHTLTITLFDADGNQIGQRTLDTELWESSSSTQNYESAFAVQLDEAIIARVEILNSSNVEFANALVIDEIAYSHTPIVSADFVTLEDVPLTTPNVLANDIDPEGSALSVGSFTQPEHGSVVYNGDGTFTYTPDVDYGGPDSFTYEAVDADGGVTTGTVEVFVRSANDAAAVDAGVDQAVSEGDIVTLSGSGSDVDGDALTYEWVQTGGPTVTLTGGDGANPTFEAPEGLSNTDLTFELRVSDGQVTSVDTVTVHVAADDDAPSASAGADQFVDENTPVTLTGSGVDPEGQGLTYEWVQTGGPTVALTGADGATPTFDAPEGLANTDLTFELRVSDGVNTSVDTVTVHVAADDDAPTASAGADQFVDENATVTLTGSGVDPEGQGLTYEWVQTGGPTVALAGADGASPTFDAPEGLANTDLTFELRVSDGVNTSVDTVIVHVAADDDAPSAIAGADQFVDENALVTLTGSGVDPEGQGLTYEWVQTGGPTVALTGADGASPTFDAPEGLANTDLTFELRVSDGVNLSVDTVTIHVAADDDAPSASAGSDQFVDENAAVTLTGSGVDPEGQGLTYEWVQTGGPTVALTGADGATPTFDAPEGLANTDLTFELRVSDGVNTSVDTVTVHVAADDDAPTASAGADQFVDENATVTLTGSGVDPEGQGLTYEWVQTGGPTVALAGADGASPTFDAPEGLANTDLTFELRVSDGVNTSVDTVIVHVAADDDAPSAIAGADQFVDENALVTLTGSGVDPEGQGLTYEWVQTGGPTVALTGADGASPTFDAPEGLANTDLTFELRVSDGVNLSVDTVTIHVAADDDAPSASAGSDQFVDENAAVTLTGSGVDPEGQGLTYDWVQTGGPTVALTGADGASPTFDAPEGLANTDLTFELRVSDGVNLSVDTVTIHVAADDDAPSASAGSDQFVDENAAVTLTGSGVDPEGQGLTYEWVQTGGPTVALTGADGASPTFDAPEGLANTDLTFELRVSDGVNLSVDTVTIHVAADDDAPSASAGSDQFVDENAAVTLTGSGVDPEGQGLTYEWVQTGGPTVALAGADGASPTFDAPEGLANTDLTFELRVSDGVNTSVDTVTVHVAADDDAPSADAGSDQFVDENDAVTLSGSGVDPEGQGLTYQWVQTGGPTVALTGADGASPTFDAPEGLVNTDLTFELRVSDGVNLSVDTVTIHVAADDDAPTASAGSDQFVDETSPVTLTGSGVDPEGQGLTYEWVQTGGPTVALTGADGASPTFDAPEGLVNTDLTFELRVSDDVNLSVDTVTIHVAADDDAPSASAGSDQFVDENAPVTLTGSGVDPEGQGLTYEWVQTGGPTVALTGADGASPTFDAPEGLANTDLTFELRVSDGVNLSVDTVTIHVAADDDAPSASAGSDQFVDENSPVTLTGSGVDPEGQGLTYEWVQTGGPTVALTGADGASPTFDAPEGLANTDLTFELRVSDGVNTSVDTLTIHVAADDDAPTAGAGVDQWVDEHDRVQLSGFGVDPEGQGLTYEWVQTGGPAVGLVGADGPEPSFDAPEGLVNTDLTFELRVSDGANTSVDTVTIHVAADDDAPSADAGADLVVGENEPVVLSGSGVDPEGQGLSYRWVQVSGPEVELDDADSADLRFDAPELAGDSDLVFQLAVSDGTNTSIDTVTVHVQAEDDVPVIRIDEGDLYVKAGDSIQFETGAFDLEGQELTYTWRQVEGPPVSLIHGDTPQPVVGVPADFGNVTLRFELEVSDGTNVVTQMVELHVQDDVLGSSGLEDGGGADVGGPEAAGPEPESDEAPQASGTGLAAGAGASLEEVAHSPTGVGAPMELPSLEVEPDLPMERHDVTELGASDEDLDDTAPALAAEALAAGFESLFEPVDDRGEVGAESVRLTPVALPDGGSDAGGDGGAEPEVEGPRGLLGLWAMMRGLAGVRDDREGEEGRSGR
ncbi:PKD domain-containing protein [Engelhardtia mirabilis]|uniref:Bifunctional hemolysin/adenylate cyclase n=1 Tax=Engelhardtia mirabilis TaxID=2528011 RepID=A0A518BNL7_9BACT|nr:Bifunctional hemolysin/adenylate cyclase precursor [Planctomycetes bacterium Pla133]QDV02871.1 Bifunctional hemolysin/adenylate cyclase precursor [Planctomycetes bacterium Pla86]